MTKESGVTAACVVLITAKARVLLINETDGSVGFPGGKRRRAADGKWLETPQECARREFGEEVGITCPLALTEVGVFAVDGHQCAVFVCQDELPVYDEGGPQKRHRGFFTTLPSFLRRPGFVRSELPLRFPETLLILLHALSTLIAPTEKNP